MPQEWDHDLFVEEADRVENEIGQIEPEVSTERAIRLRDKCIEAGPGAYKVAAYDIAYSCWLLGRAYSMAGTYAKALFHLEEAQDRFELLKRTFKNTAAYMSALIMNDRADCHRHTGSLEMAIDQYENAMDAARRIGHEQLVANVSFQLATALHMVGRNQEAIALMTKARDFHGSRDDHLRVAMINYQMGQVQEAMGEFRQAFENYDQAFRDQSRLGDSHGLAVTLGATSRLLNKVGQHEEAVEFGRAAVEISSDGGDAASEGVARNILAVALMGLGDHGSARTELTKTVELLDPADYQYEPWLAWHALAQCEEHDDRKTESAKSHTRAYEIFLEYRRDGGQNKDPLWLEFWRLMDEVMPPTLEDVREVVEQVSSSMGVPGPEQFSGVTIVEDLIEGGTIEISDGYVEAVEAVMIQEALRKPSHVPLNVIPRSMPAQTSISVHELITAKLRIGLRFHFFISYTKDDATLARNLCESLQKNGLRVFYDRDKGELDTVPKRTRGIDPRGEPIEGGDYEIGKVLGEEIESSLMLLILVSNSSLKSDWVNIEITHALEARMPILVWHLEDPVGREEYDAMAHAVRLPVYQALSKDTDEPLVLDHLDFSRDEMDKLVNELTKWLELVEYTLWKGEPARADTVIRYNDEYSEMKGRIAKAKRQVQLEFPVHHGFGRRPSTEFIPSPDERHKRRKPFVVLELEHWEKYLNDPGYRSRLDSTDE